MKSSFRSIFFTKNSKSKGHEALERMMEGNKRFVQGVRTIEHLPTPSKLKELSVNGQKPFCIILSCADSRVPSEMVFDMGLGDLFVLRVAGNVISRSLLASIEFAATNFGTPLLMVMGHSKCGAIKATIESVKHNTSAPSQNLQDLIDLIKPSVEKNLPHHGSDEEKIMDTCTRDNVLNTIQSIYKQSDIIQSLVNEKKLLMVGSVFDLDTGKVSFNEIKNSTLLQKTA